MSSSSKPVQNSPGNVGSKKITSLNDLPRGGVIGLPEEDLSSALKLLAELNVIKLAQVPDDHVVTLKHVIENPKNIKLIPNSKVHDVFTDNAPYLAFYFIKITLCK